MGTTEFPDKAFQELLNKLEESKAILLADAVDNDIVLKDAKNIINNYKELTLKYEAQKAELVKKALEYENKYNYMLTQTNINNCTESEINNPINIGKAVYGIANLDNKIKEAENDAISHFEKKCPYCGKGLYEGNIRDKYEIDHFYPISKGGQHFPWNILPVCKKCNSSKKAKLPREFLSEKNYRICCDYLAGIKSKYSNEADSIIEDYELIKKIIFDWKDGRHSQPLLDIAKIVLKEDSLPFIGSKAHTNPHPAIQTAIDENRIGFRGGWISSLALDKLLGKTVARNKRREQLEQMGYYRHPALPEGKSSKLIPQENGRPTLYCLKNGPLWQPGANVASVVADYEKTQWPEG